MARADAFSLAQLTFSIMSYQACVIIANFHQAFTVEIGSALYEEQP